MKELSPYYGQVLRRLFDAHMCASRATLFGFDETHAEIVAQAMVDHMGSWLEYDAEEAQQAFSYGPPKLSEL